MERWEGKRLPLWWGERVEKSRGQERGKPGLHLLLQIPLEVKALLKLAGVKEGCTQRRGDQWLSRPQLLLRLLQALSSEKHFAPWGWIVSGGLNMLLF